MVVLALVACGAPGEAGIAFTPPPTPAEHIAGEAFFTVHCLRCHGMFATGTDSGPPLVHEVYRTAHHADAAFELAVKRGVPAHHWKFGDMPPQPQVPDSQVTPIVGYVRWLQRHAGVE
jgi:cytochrome c2